MSTFQFSMRLPSGAILSLEATVDEATMPAADRQYLDELCGHLFSWRRVPEYETPRLTRVGSVQDLFDRIECRETGRPPPEIHQCEDTSCEGFGTVDGH
jgi:hypothetical protein